MPLCSVRLSKKRHFTQLKSEPSSTVFTSPEESLTPSLSPFHLGLMVSNVIVFCYLPFGFWSRRVEGLSTEHSVPCFGTWPNTSLSQHTVCNGWPSCAFFVVVVSKPNQRETQEKSGRVQFALDRMYICLTFVQIIKFLFTFAYPTVCFSQAFQVYFLSVISLSKC